MWTLRNNRDRYGLIAVVLHWITAIAVVGLFALGLWMVGLDYYHPWYRDAPAIHKGIGVLLFAVVSVRLLWRLSGPLPRPEPGWRAFERRAAPLVHRLLYLLLFGTMASGYLISTADGRPIDVFGVISIPAVVSDLPAQADRAGDVHLALAIALIALASIHAAGALKHHFSNRDNTLMRMLRIHRKRRHQSGSSP